MTSAPDVARGLQFVEEGHRYFLDGAEVPSVTQVIAAAGLADWSHCSEWARERGSVVHKAVHVELATKRLNWSSFDEMFHPHVSAALQCLVDLEAQTIEVERRVFSRIYGYAGTLDWLGIIDSKRTLIDWKTGPTVPSYGPQTAAYVDALHEETSDLIERRYAVRLLADGSYKVEQFTDRQDIQVFRAALRISQWKRQKGLEVAA